MTFDPKAYAAKVRKMSGAELLEAFMMPEPMPPNVLRTGIQHAELLRRLSPKVDRAKLADVIFERDGYGKYSESVQELHQLVARQEADEIADLIESGQVPTVEE